VTTPAKLDLASVFDLDAVETAYRPLTVKHDGQEYVFGRSTLGLLAAMQKGDGFKKAEGETDMAFAQRLMGALPEMVSLVCPEFPPPPWDVRTESGLFKAVTEVLSRVGQIDFQA